MAVAIAEVLIDRQVLYAGANGQMGREVRFGSECIQVAELEGQEIDVEVLVVLDLAEDAVHRELDSMILHEEVSGVKAGTEGVIGVGVVVENGAREKAVERPTAIPDHGRCRASSENLQQQNSHDGGADSRNRGHGANNTAHLPSMQRPSQAALTPVRSIGKMPPLFTDPSSLPGTLTGYGAS